MKVRDYEKQIQSLTDKNKNHEEHEQQMKLQIVDTMKSQNTIAKYKLEQTMLKKAVADIQRDEKAARHELQLKLDDSHDSLVIAETSISDLTATLETTQKELTQLREENYTMPVIETGLVIAETSTSDLTATLETTQKELTQLREERSKKPPATSKLYQCSDTKWLGIPVEHGNLILKGNVHRDLILQARLPTPIITLNSSQLKTSSSGIINLDPLWLPDNCLNIQKTALKKGLIREFKKCREINVL